MGCDFGGIDLVMFTTISSGHACCCVRYRYGFWLLLSRFWFVAVLEIVIGRGCKRNKGNQNGLWRWLNQFGVAFDNQFCSRFLRRMRNRCIGQFLLSWCLGMKNVALLLSFWSCWLFRWWLIISKIDLNSVYSTGASLPAELQMKSHRLFNRPFTFMSNIVSISS